MSHWTTVDYLQIAAYVMFYLLGMWNGWDKARKKYRGY